MRECHIGSSQLLMLSGIGPAKHFSELDINVIRDLPIDENLMDHVAFDGLTWIVDEPVNIRIADMINIKYMKDFLMRQSGLITVPDACGAFVFIDTKHSTKLHSLSNIELLFIGCGFKEDMILSIITGLNNASNMEQI